MIEGYLFLNLMFFIIAPTLIESREASNFPCTNTESGIIANWTLSGASYKQKGIMLDKEFDCSKGCSTRSSRCGRDFCNADNMSTYDKSEARKSLSAQPLNINPGGRISAISVLSTFISALLLFLLALVIQ